MQENNNNNQFYCRLEVFCNSNIFLPDFKQEKCFIIEDDENYIQDKEYEVYAQEFDDYDSVVNCLLEIEKAWENINKTEDLHTDEGASIIIYNRWKIDLYIGMYKNKWLLSHSSEYTHEWKENFAKNVNAESKIIVLRLPYYQEEFEDKFISKEKVCSLIKKWLETNDKSGDFDGDQLIMYMEEILG